MMDLLHPAAAGGSGRPSPHRETSTEVSWAGGARWTRRPGALWAVNVLTQLGLSVGPFTWFGPAGPGEAMAKQSRKRETEEPQVLHEHYRKRKTGEPQSSMVSELGELPRDRTDPAKTQVLTATLAASCPGEASLAWSSILRIVVTRG